ncbi:hypothetical protein CEY16_06520 [Halalkalibacillus sediminis]|uniref:YusW-like protein n=1 Tax=Halalkalibacillus sediminis TaxID=2018042 RepID=A0A2I0QTG0_9BACI|nr:YusW family protein [Halalkalibacillus sediminis]PKR77588.1 hypothetical protein CEY16_06520 [Halalkalibacillus sediminis]
MNKLSILFVTFLFLVACGTTEEPTDNNSEDTSGEENQQEESNGETSNESEEDTSSKDDEKSESNAGTADVREFDLEVELSDDNEWDYDYRRDNVEETKIERDNGDSVSGQKATSEIEELLSKISITTDRPLVDMKDEVLSAINLSSGEAKEFELETQLNSGEIIEFDHKGSQNTDPGAISEFGLSIDFNSQDSWEYEYEVNEEAEIERGNEEVEGSQAKEEIESLLNNLDLTRQHSIEEMKQALFKELEINEDNVEKIELEVAYESGEEMKFKHDKEE